MDNAMAVVLEGGCRVTNLKEGEPSREGNLRIWPLFGRHVGAHAISFRTLELDEAASLHNEECEEVLYVLEGEGTATVDGKRYKLHRDVGIYLAPDVTLTIESGAPMTFVSSRCPDPCSGGLQPAVQAAGGLKPAATPVVRLEDRPPQRTGNRWYREIVSGEVTQFVGSIPPGRAPDHFHLYEEVICILEGTGVMWAGKSQTPIGAGSCIFLPRKQIHCVENTGPGELRLLGVFYPAGSPAVRYEIDNAS